MGTDSEEYQRGFRDGLAAAAKQCADIELERGLTSANAIRREFQAEDKPTAALNVTPGLYRMPGGGVAVVRSTGPGGASGHIPEAKTRTKWATCGIWGVGAGHPWDLVECIEEYT